MIHKVKIDMKDLFIKVKVCNYDLPFYFTKVIINCILFYNSIFEKKLLHIFYLWKKNASLF